jgi:hypothetical protein
MAQTGRVSDIEYQKQRNLNTNSRGHGTAEFITPAARSNATAEEVPSNNLYTKEQDGWRHVVRACCTMKLQYGTG